MSTITVVVEETAAALWVGLPEVARRVWLAQKDGIITPGQHGKAAQATARDAASILGVNLISAPAPLAATALVRVGGLRAKPLRIPIGLDGDGDVIWRDLAPSDSWLDAVTTVIELQRRGDPLAARIEAIGVTETGSGTIWPWLKPTSGTDELQRRAGRSPDYRFVYGDLEGYGLNRDAGRVRETWVGYPALIRIAAALDRERPRKPPKPRSSSRDEERPETEAPGRSQMVRPATARASAQKETRAPIGCTVESSAVGRERQHLGHGGTPHRAHGLDGNDRSDQRRVDSAQPANA